MTLIALFVSLLLSSLLAYWGIVSWAAFRYPQPRLSFVRSRLKTVQRQAPMTAPLYSPEGCRVPSVFLAEIIRQQNARAQSR